MRDSRGYRDLVVGQRAMDLGVEVCHCTKTFPRDEMFGLSTQMRRAAVSVPSNIAGGKGAALAQGVQSLFHARRSLLELQTQITLAKRVGSLTQSALDLGNTSNTVFKLLNGLVHRFQPSLATP